MEVVRKFVDASKLMTFMSLPKAFQNKKLEIIVLPVEEEVQEMEQEIDISDTVQSLIGSIPNDSKLSLEDYRAERLKKYEIAD